MVVVDKGFKKKLINQVLSKSKEVRVRIQSNDFCEYMNMFDAISFFRNFDKKCFSQIVFNKDEIVFQINNEWYAVKIYDFKTFKKYIRKYFYILIFKGVDYE